MSHPVQIYKNNSNVTLIKTGYQDNFRQITIYRNPQGKWRVEISNWEHVEAGSYTDNFWEMIKTVRAYKSHAGM